MPPTLEQLRTFDEAHASERFNLTLDKLLDSPHYGERWARHWMDVARYADSNGLDENTAFANAWRVGVLLGVRRQFFCQTVAGFGEVLQHR